MPNRITYNAEDVFVGSPNIEEDPSFNYMSDYSILKRLSRIQSFQYSIEQRPESQKVLGAKSVIDVQKLTPPAAQINYNYIVHGIENEKRIGFYVQEESSERKNFFSKFVDDSRSYDRRNYYLTTRKDGESFRDGSESFYTDVNLDFDDGDLPLITDPRSPNYDVLSFQNCYLSNYEFSLAVGQLATTSIKLEADNMIFFISGSGIGIPVLESKTGEIVHSGEKFVIPKRFKESDDRGLLQALIFRNGDVSLDITKNEVVTETIYTSDFSSSADGWSAPDRGIVTHGEQGGTALKMVANENTTSDYHFVIREFDEIKAGKRYKVTAKIFIPSGGTNIRGFQLRQNWGTSVTGPIHPPLDAWYDFSHEYVASDMNADGTFPDGAIEFWMANSGLDNAASTFAWVGQADDIFYIKDIVVEEVINTPTFHNDKVQTLSVAASMERMAVDYLTHKNTFDRPAISSSVVDVSLTYLADVGISGNFLDTTEETENYDMTIKFIKDNNVIIRYDFLGATLMSNESQGSIGANKQDGISFAVNMDFDNNKKGFFVSGKRDFSEISVTDQHGNQLTSDGQDISYGLVVQY